MTAQEVDYRRQIFKLIENYSSVKIKKSTVISEEVELDSMNKTCLCIDLESEFDISIPDDFFDEENINGLTASELADKIISIIENDLKQ